jgi:CheY-like chemotaxis protein
VQNLRNKITNCAEPRCHRFAIELNSSEATAFVLGEDGKLLARNQLNAKEIDQPVVLIVEEEFFVRCAVGKLAREAGLAVIEAASAKQAMAACHVGTTVHALITDIQLEDPTNGWDLAEAFRGLRTDMPVIYTSGIGSNHARPVPNSLFFNKPYLPSAVVGACKQLIAAH